MTNIRRALSMATLLVAGLLPVVGTGQQAANTAQAPAAGRGGGVPAQGAEIDIQLVNLYDRDRNGRLDYSERTEARQHLAAHPELRRPVREDDRPD